MLAAFSKCGKRSAGLTHISGDFVDDRPLVNTVTTLADYQATCAESDRLSKDLKQRGFKFIGSTTCYAHMQAAGLVNDHTVDCFRRQEIIASY